MTRSIHPKRAALVFGILLGGAHLFWALLVAVGWAQPLIDFIFWLHFGAMLADQHDEWTIARQYLSEAPMALFDKACHTIRAQPVPELVEG